MHLEWMYLERTGGQGAFPETRMVDREDLKFEGEEEISGMLVVGIHQFRV